MIFYQVNFKRDKWCNFDSFYVTVSMSSKYKVYMYDSGIITRFQLSFTYF